MLLVAFLLVDAPNCHLSLVLASVVQGDAVNCNTANTSDHSSGYSGAVSGMKGFKKPAKVSILDFREHRL